LQSLLEEKSSLQEWGGEWMVKKNSWSLAARKNVEEYSSREC
jgi:hypothetical protein